MEAHTFNPCRGRKIAEYDASLDNTKKYIKEPLRWLHGLKALLVTVQPYIVVL